MSPSLFRVFLPISYIVLIMLIFPPLITFCVSYADLNFIQRLHVAFLALFTFAKISISHLSVDIKLGQGLCLVALKTSFHNNFTPLSKRHTSLLQIVDQFCRLVRANELGRGRIEHRTQGFIPLLFLDVELLF